MLYSSRFSEKRPKLQSFRPCAVKALTGKSPSLFIRSIRLCHARHLLQTTGLTVSEIAYEVGYSGLNNFSDAFLEEFGEHPLKVRG